MEVTGVGVDRLEAIASTPCNIVKKKHFNIDSLLIKIHAGFCFLFFLY